MKSNLALEIKNLSKEYQITHKGKRSGFLALDDINLEVDKGKVVGIVGQNGAGKSTLLKILSRITYPTSGEVLLRGTLCSLLEVGTGFHAELSGRENIFLNGSILGMNRNQIKERFDEIVDFSGIEEFIDTPVKHYSSGMYVRLAFSVAANLSPDILLIDEVLAVGDAAFQKKCLERTDRARREEGRTVLFVSHNMSAVREICDEVVWLKDGKIHEQGPTEQVTSNYLQDFAEISKGTPVSERKDRIGTGEVTVSTLEWDSESKPLVSGKSAKLVIGYQSHLGQNISGLNFRMNIFKENGEFLTSLSNEMVGQALTDVPANGTVICQFDSLPFLAGEYYIISNLLVSGVRNDQVDRALTFTVMEGDRDNMGSMRTASRAGVRVDQKWRLTSEDQ